MIFLRSLCLITILLFAQSCASDRPSDSQPVGSYVSVPTTDTGVQDAATFAVDYHAATAGQNLTLKSIEAAEQQVVAGMNYKLTLSIGEDGEDKTADVAVYRNAEGEMILNSWVWQ